MDAISLVMPAGSRLEPGLLRSMAPIVNCVILDSAPVGVHEVSAIALVQITVSTKINGRETKASSHGTPKNRCVTAPHPASAFARPFRSPAVWTATVPTSAEGTLAALRERYGEHPELDDLLPNICGGHYLFELAIQLGRDRRNIHAHYDLGNEFYALWLDPTMTYSSGLFSGDPTQGLEEAQLAKYQNELKSLQEKRLTRKELGNPVPMSAVIQQLQNSMSPGMALSDVSIETRDGDSYTLSGAQITASLTGAGTVTALDDVSLDIVSGDFAPTNMESKSGGRMAASAPHSRSGSLAKAAATASRTSARISALVRIRSFPRVYGTTQKAQ